jgi:signal transduction histidine kinase
MKLLTKTSIYYVLFSLLAFLIGGLIFKNVIKTIFYTQLDDTLKTEKLLILEQINYSDSLPDFRTVFGHMIEVTVFNEPKKTHSSIKNTYLYDPDKSELILHRHLIEEGTATRNRGYIISIYKPLDETQNLITAILLAMTFLFIILMGLLIFVNYFSSRRVWVPFYKTISKLSKYDISQDKPLELPETTTREFVLLNKALDRMSKKIRKDYSSLKEFNENASHELQTPLSIIKSKLELLIQNEKLNGDQMQLINSALEAVSRISRLNQGLLLISKIDNNQFSAVEEVDINSLIVKHLENLEEFIQMKGIRVNHQGTGQVRITINRILAEILVSNLLTNAVKHNIPGGSIDISLDDSHLTVSNTGQPLNVDPIKLFERFRKSQRSADSVGLGLAIVKEITDNYQMKIEYTCIGNIHRLHLVFRPVAGF